MGEPKLFNGLPLLSAGLPAVSPDCCCCDCTVSFSYEEVDDDPCTLSFTDESTCACGAIVSWIWSVNGETFSSDQNPSGVNMEDYGDGPWLVTLTVTDECGCEESASMYVGCLPPPTGCCADLPSAVIVVSTGFGTCSACTALNGTFLVPIAITGFDECTGTIAVSISGTCDGLSYTSIQIQVRLKPNAVTGNRELLVNFSSAGGGANYKAVVPHDYEDCKGSYEPTYVSDNWVTTGCTAMPGDVSAVIL